MSQQAEVTIINIISGKGGTGKTLFACVLADMLGNAPDTSVLMVDLDVFVRGLTSLLYFHREERLHIAAEDELVVAKLFTGKVTKPSPTLHRLAITKYRSFDVVPAVSRIDEVLSVHDLSPDNHLEARRILQTLLALIPAKYRFVVLDSRAGYDELIAATHELSDVSICVEEPDPISRVTADNLLAQLRSDSQTPLFRLTNKARGITSEKDLQRETTRPLPPPLQVRDVTDLGLIPFDMDVLNSFGAKDFWDQIVHSLYRVAVTRVWNRLAAELQLGVELSSPRLSPVGSERLEARVGLLAWRERIYLVYGLLIALVGIVYGLGGREMLVLFQEDPLRLVSLVIGFLGLVFTLSIFLRLGRR